ncbi:hypothetical protein cypCar_00020480 [Cyprinus carpio]|nr:hypothetical protein cypCar_00020480 [Cyprinus carpio]
MVKSNISLSKCLYIKFFCAVFCTEQQSGEAQSRAAGEQEMNRCLRANQTQLQAQLQEEERRAHETGPNKDGQIAELAGAAARRHVLPGDAAADRPHAGRRPARNPGRSDQHRCGPAARALGPRPRQTERPQGTIQEGKIVKDMCLVYSVLNGWQKGCTANEEV